MKIYKITCKVGEKRSYIGQTIRDVKQRWKEHVDIISDYPLSRALQKYGKKKFKFEVIDEASTIEELNQKEQYWIEYYDTFNNGYNTTTGGENYIRREETKQKISQALTGRTLDEEHVKAVSETNKERMRTDEEFIAHQKMISELGAQKIRQRVKCSNGVIYNSIKEAAEAHGMTANNLVGNLLRGTTLNRGLVFEYADKPTPVKEVKERKKRAYGPNTEQQKARISATMSDRIKNDPNLAEIHRQRSEAAWKATSKKIRCHQNDVVYNSTGEAARELNISRPNISKHLKTGKSSVKGYTFEYVD